MKLALGLMFQNEAAWLHAHLPILLQSRAIDGIVAVDGGSTDGGAQVIEALGGTVRQRPWDWRPLDQENAVIEMAEELGYDFLLLTAPDELWFPAHIDQIKFTLGQGRWLALRFPTYNFMKDRHHYCPTLPYYPDSHVRAWKLGCGIRHTGDIDSVPLVDDRDVLYMPHIHMFHYAHIKDRAWYTLKGHNFHRVKNGQEPLKRLPEGTPLAAWPDTIIPYIGEDPLRPLEANTPVYPRHPFPCPNIVPDCTLCGAFIYRDDDAPRYERPVPWELLPREPGTVVEIGAEDGTFGVNLKARSPHTSMIVVDITQQFEMLCLNLAHWRDVHCYKAMSLVTVSNGGFYRMISKHDFRKIDILKIDRDSHELLLRGLTEDDLRRVKTLITERDALPETLRVKFDLVGTNGHYTIWSRHED